MSIYVGRVAELRVLREALEEVRTPAGGGSGTGSGTGPGIGSGTGAAAGASHCVVVTGPAGSGKTRLVGEFVRRSRRPALFHAVAPGPPDAQLAAFAADAGRSELPGAQRFRDILATDWDTVCQLVAGAVDDQDGPTVVVLDGADRIEPGSARSDVGNFWDAWRQHVHEGVLLVLTGRTAGGIIGALDPDAATSISLDTFTPRGVARNLELAPAHAFEAHLASGGHPEIVSQWPTGAPVLSALARMLERSPSAWEIVAERDLGRRYGPDTQTRAVIDGMAGQRQSRSALARATGLPAASLDRALKRLMSDGVITVDRPLSLRPSREARYRLADPYLQFWMTTIGTCREEIARGDIDRVMEIIGRRWPAWRDGAIITAVRRAMDRLARHGQLPGTGGVGGYWARFDGQRVDLVGVDEAVSPTAVTFVGTVKWDPDHGITHADVGELIATRDAVPGAGDTTPLVGVSLAPTSVGDALAATLGPAELLSAWDDAND